MNCVSAPLRTLLLASLGLALVSCAPVRGSLAVFEGNIYSSRGAYTEALGAYLRSLDAPEAAPYGEYGLGTVYRSLGETASALRSFAQAEEALAERDEGSDRELRYRLAYNQALARFQSGDYAGAAGGFRDALERDSARLEAKRNLELSLRSLSRKSASASSAAPLGTNGQAGPSTTIFEYIREKERDKWKSRENAGDQGSALDY